MQNIRRLVATGDAAAGMRAAELGGAEDRRFLAAGARVVAPPGAMEDRVFEATGAMAAEVVRVVGAGAKVGGLAIVAGLAVAGVLAIAGGFTAPAGVAFGAAVDSVFSTFASVAVGTKQWSLPMWRFNSTMVVNDRQQRRHGLLTFRAWCFYKYKHTTNVWLQCPAERQWRGE